MKKGINNIISEKTITVILVGTQVDLRWKAMRETVSTAKGRALAAHIGAVEFFECSALTQYNLKQVRMSQ